MNETADIKFNSPTRGKISFADVIYDLADFMEGNPKEKYCLIIGTDSKTNNLEDNQKILEIGSGSGYVLALINELSPDSQIYGVERLGALALKSQKVLKNKENIHIFKKDGYDGLKKYAPYNRILISAAADELPKHLISQLVNGGIMVLPVQNSIFHIKRTSHGFIKREFPGFVFVPLIKD